MKEAATTKAFVKMMAAFVTMVGKHPLIVPVCFQFNWWYKNHNSSNSDKYNYLFFPQISIAPKTMTATTKDFAQTEHACVNQAGKAIWIAQVTWSEKVKLLYTSK